MKNPYGGKLAQAIEWKYGPVASINLDTGEIISWRSDEAQPTPLNYASIVAEYDEYEPPLPLSDQLAHAFNQLPVSVRAAYAPLRVSIDDALARGDEELAKEIIKQAQVPAELEDTKTALLSMFAGGGV